MTDVNQRSSTPTASRSPVPWSILYAGSAVILAPQIYLGGYALFTTGGGDYCDGSYGHYAGEAPAGSIPGREAEFRSAQLFQVSGAGVLLAVGLGLLVWLWVSRHRIGRTRFGLGSAAVLIGMIGYGLVIALAGPGGQVC